MKLSDSFPSTSKTDWLKKVTKELKGKPIEELNFDLWPNHSVSPFYHRDDKAEIISSISEVAPPKLGFSLNVDDEQRANILILEELKGGVSVINLSFTIRDVINFEVLLEGVFVDLIQLRLEVGGKENIVQAAVEYLSGHYEPQNLDVIIQDGSSESDHPFKRGVGLKQNSSDNPEELLLNFLNESQKFIEEASASDVFIFRLPFGNDYFLNMITARAAQLLWQNISEAYDMAPNLLMIDGVVNRGALCEDQHDNMIALSQICSCMLTSGVQTVFIPPSNAKEHSGGNEHTRRISRNIYHLLTMESHLSKVKDPAAGSYFFDNETYNLAFTVWNQFISRQDR